MFEVTIKQEDLMTALKALNSTVGKNTQNLGDNCLSMKCDANGKIAMETNNTLELTSVEVIANSTSNDVAPDVDFNRFKGIVSTIAPKEYITLKQNVNDLFISFGMRKPIKLVGVTTKMIPYPTTTTANTMSIPYNVAVGIVNAASSIIVESSATPIYNCVRIATDGPNISAEVVDIVNKRTLLCEEVNTTNNPQMNILIEVNKLKKVISSFADYAYIDFNVDTKSSMVEVIGNTSNNANAILNNVKYCARSLAGNLPNVKQYFAKQPTEMITISKEDFMSTLSRIKAIGDDTSFKSGVQFVADKNSFEVKFNSTLGDLQDPIDVIAPITTSFSGTLNHKSIEDLLNGIADKEILIGHLPNTPWSFLVYGKTHPTTKFTITGMSQAPITQP